MSPKAAPIRPQKLVLDASVVLKSYLPEEGSAQAQAIFKARALGHVGLLAPSLMPYEVTNALLVALRKQRIDRARAEEILREFMKLGIPTQELGGLEERAWALALEYQRTAYDAAYLALAEHEELQLITGDKRLYNAVKGKLDWVKWVGDYRSVSVAGVEEPE